MTIVSCPNPAPVPPSGVVVFDPAIFTTLYPEFAGIPTAALQFNFNRAQLQLNNSCQSAVQNAQTRQLLLGLLTAHITIIANGTNTGGASPITTPPLGIVGRISDATEGSVSVHAEYDMSGSPSQAYYVQTKYGAEFWQATVRFRTARYVPPPIYPGWGNGFGPGYGGCGPGGWWGGP